MSSANVPRRTGVANLPLHYGKAPLAVLSDFRGQALNLVDDESDSARYSFARGGKDGIPYPVDRKTYDQSIELLQRAIRKTKLGLREKEEAMGGLRKMVKEK